MFQVKIALPLPQIRRRKSQIIEKHFVARQSGVMPWAMAEKIAAARSRLLLLDYDGTLAPFAPNRDDAAPYLGVRALLQKIMNTCNTRLVMITDRTPQDVPLLLRVTPQPEIWGSRGFVRLYPDGRCEMPVISQEVQQCLDKAASELFSQQLDEVIEVKPGAVAVHWRGLPGARLEQVKATAYRVLSSAIRNSGLRLEVFDGGLELRVRGPDKGDAVRTILTDTAPETPVAYLGDDVTDEQAFRALSGRGLTALVNSTYRFSAAQIWLRPPDELISFLQDWIQACANEV